MSIFLCLWPLPFTVRVFHTLYDLSHFQTRFLHPCSYFLTAGSLLGRHSREVFPHHLHFTDRKTEVQSCTSIWPDPQVPARSQGQNTKPGIRQVRSSREGPGWPLLCVSVFSSAKWASPLWRCEQLWVLNKQSLKRAQGCPQRVADHLSLCLPPLLSSWFRLPFHCSGYWLTSEHSFSFKI